VSSHLLRFVAEHFRSGLPSEFRIRRDAGAFMSTKLYVGNLPYQTTESDLQALFESSGSVASISVVRDRATGQARGFAFVEMSDAEGAQRAIKELDRQEYGGRQLTVNEAKPMVPRGNDRGGGGGGRQRRESRW
jgi:RNA recognition motif-containing protein